MNTSQPSEASPNMMLFIKLLCIKLMTSCKSCHTLGWIGLIALSFSLFYFHLSPFDGDIIIKPDDALYVKLGHLVMALNRGQEGWRDQMLDGMRLAPPHDETDMASC